MMVKRVWIAQCLCPKRHCILATADEASSRVEAEAKVLHPLRHMVTLWLRERRLDPWCGICSAGDSTWRYEVGRTGWSTLTEAMPGLKESEAKQALAAVLMGRRDFFARR